MYREILIQAGLDDKEVLVYEALLACGQANVKALLADVSLKRGDVYNILYRLRDKKLIKEGFKRGITYFSLESPGRIEELIAERRERFTQTEKSLAELMPKMKAQYLIRSEDHTSELQSQF